MTCEECTFWNPTPGPGGGQCRRYAPKPSNSRIDRVYWPRTIEDDVCGEWQERLK